MKQMTKPFTFGPADVLLVVDVINDFEHDDGDRLLASFRERLEPMAETIAKARTAAIPIIYVNDEGDRWDSNAPALTKTALESDRGFEIVERLAPRPGDHFLLKHRYSARAHTTPELLLRQLDADPR